jgi:hypothetical protein
MARKELLEKIVEIREGLGELEELAGKETEGKAERSVFFLALEDAAKLLRAGFGGIFRVGDVIVSRHADVGRIAWTVIGKDADKDPENPERPTMTLFMRDALPGFWRFDTSRPGAPYGDNRWATSAIRRRLNESLLGGFTEEEQAAMIAVDKLTYDRETGKEERTHDKLFLLSCTEAGFEPGAYIRDEGPAYPYFTGSESRVKLDEDGDARYWWLRSPYPGYARYVRNVNPDGSLNSNTATYGLGAAAACVIG